MNKNSVISLFFFFNLVKVQDVCMFMGVLEPWTGINIPYLVVTSATVSYIVKQEWGDGSHIKRACEHYRLRSVATTSSEYVPRFHMDVVLFSKWRAFVCCHNKYLLKNILPISRRVPVVWHHFTSWNIEILVLAVYPSSPKTSVGSTAGFISQGGGSLWMTHFHCEVYRSAHAVTRSTVERCV